MHSNGPAKILVLVIASILLGCGSPPRAKIPDRPGRVDAPIVLASDDDLGEVRAAYDALALDAPGRDTRRNELASEYSRRIESTLRRGKRTRAFLHFESLLQLWRPMELQQAHETTEFVALVPIAELLRKTFAKSGGDLEASAALYAMALMQPGKASKHYSDIEEIFQYGDELAVLEHGPGARRSRPISILESTVRFLPSASVVSRLVALYTERQEAIKSSFRRKGADMQLLRIHGPGVLTTAQNIVRILAESGRIRDARNAIASISGIGDDARLRKRLVAASTSSGPTPWLLLSANFLDVEGDEGAALAICREAIRLYPKAAMSYVCAGESAEKLGNILLAIRYYELALKFGPEQRKTNEALATLYEQRVSTLAYSDRPNAALAQLKTFEALHKSAAKRFETPLLPDLASAYTAMARGLVSLGELAEAHLYLARSIRLRPSLSAFEELGTIALRQEQFVEARSHFEKALALPTEQLEELFHRAAIRRISAEALAGNGDEEGAREQRELAFATWLELLNKYELSTAGESEARIEIGKLMFSLGRDEEAMSEFLSALDDVPTNAAHADVVSFLLQNGRYALAKDVYLDALGHSEQGQYYKIYMSLWILAEAKHLGLEPNYHAGNFLRSLEGRLWSVRLAKYALGEGNHEALESMASTRGRRAELLYYRAVLGPQSDKPEIVRQLLEEVVRGSMVLFFEYEMAKRRLREMN